jgi:hypothetical protein
MSVQIDWAACPKCQGLFYGPFKGRCPAGGEHEQTHSFLYAITFDALPTDHMQTGWASCPKCQGMHFAGLPFKGVCPADKQQHTQTNTFAYALTHDVLPTQHVQAEWRACPKCQGLFFGPFGGRCPAGGEHSAAGSFNYCLQFLTRLINPTLRLVDEVSAIEVTGGDFTRDFKVSIDYGYQALGTDGVSFSTRGNLVVSADGNGNFTGTTFSVPSQAFNIGARAVDLTTGQDAVAPFIREQVP